MVRSMAKLSPKALRFAEAVTRSVAERHLLDDGSMATWRAWIDVGRGPLGFGAASFIDVPDDIGIVFLQAIERLISGTNTDVHDPDGEMGNDIEFLHSVQASLARNLADVRPIEASALQPYGP